MTERKIRLMSESLARVLDRRRFIKITGSTVFAGLISLAAGHGLAGEASADTRRLPRTARVPVCNPPGPYCNINGTNEPNGCLNSRPGGPYSARCLHHVDQGHTLYCITSYYWYPTGCWTYADGGGYWTCCDCGCSIEPGGPDVAFCGCAGYSLDPLPDPDRPTGPERIKARG
jgi:hypothetical protein